MKRKTYKIVLSFSLMITVFPFFTNCSAPLESFSSFSSVSDSLSPDSPLSLDKAASVNERALLTSDQLAKSMIELTGRPMEGFTLSEYTRQQSVLAGSFDAATTTAPMLIGVVNLASAFCNDLSFAERRITDVSQRRFYKTINFSSTPANLSATDYTAAIQALASAFWGRQATSEELTALMNAKAEFISGINAADNSRMMTSLTTFVCTGMLSSLESFTF